MHSVDNRRLPGAAFFFIGLLLVLLRDGLPCLHTRWRQRLAAFASIFAAVVCVECLTI